MRSLRDVVVYRFGWLTKYIKSNVYRLKRARNRIQVGEEYPESEQRVLSLDSSVFLVVIKRADSRRAFSVVALRWPRFACEKSGSGENMFTVLPRSVDVFDRWLRLFSSSIGFKRGRRPRCFLFFFFYFFLHSFSRARNWRNTKDKDRRQRWWWRLFLKYTLFPVRWLPETLTHISIFPIPFVADRKPRRIVCVESSHII